MERGHWFKSNLFKITTGEDEATNPGCYGKALAEWLCAKFRELGYETEVIPEDWGWCVMCYSGDYMLWLGCGVVQTEEFLEKYDPEKPPGPNDVVWHVFPELEVPSFKLTSKIRKWVGKLDTVSPLEKLNKELEQVLSGEQGIELCEGHL